ncbi:MAG: DNA alkylation repair protein [Bacteroidota bacterium]|nr:DNA alkylation repair protein [Bacteroidota bacterium]
MDKLQNKLEEIRSFCRTNSNPALVEKYSRYFKEGYDAYGLDSKNMINQKEYWLNDWKEELSIDDYLALGDKLFESGKYEEGSFAILFIASFKKQFTSRIFEHIGRWLEKGVNNWAHSDVIVGEVISHFIKKEIVTLSVFEEWSQSSSRWKRRAVPVSLIQALKNGSEPNDLFLLIDPMMLDVERVVHQGLGWLLREIWKKYPQETESFLLRWKDSCARLIIQYATEKMDKSQKERFKKAVTKR